MGPGKSNLSVVWADTHNRQRGVIMGWIEIHPNPQIEIRLPEKKPVRRFGPEPDFGWMSASS